MKINFVARGCISDDVAARNKLHSKSLGRPSRPRLSPGPLAVVGGGPSIRESLSTLQEWPGDVWAINSTYQWCNWNGINASAFSVDPVAGIAPLFRGAGHALLGAYCDPSVFDALDAADIEIFDVGEGGLACGATTATVAPALALALNYREVTFFGCESSWGDQTYGYDRADDPDLANYQLLVACGGFHYMTTAEFLMQAEYLATMIRAAPHVFKDRSGGLLSALVHCEEYDIVAGSQHIAKVVGYAA